MEMKSTETNIRQRCGYHRIFCAVACCIYGLLNPTGASFYSMIFILRWRSTYPLLRFMFTCA